MTILVFWIVLPIVLCHVCSLLEATLLSVRAPALLDLQKRGIRGAVWLQDIKRNRVSDAISAILTVNTLAGTIGAGFAGAQAAKLFGETSVGAVSVLMTVLLLVLSEIIPKTFAATHAPALAAAAGYSLRYLMVAMSPVLFITRALTSRLATETNEALTRRELAALISAAPADGTISGSEADILANMIYAQHVTLDEVHTRAEFVVMMNEQSTVRDLLETVEADGFSRIPLYHADRSDLIGYVSHREVLKAASGGKAKARKLKEFCRPLPELATGLTVHAAIKRLLHAREAIGKVIDPSGRLAGIVTIEDLLEALIGLDITDEPEDVAALREDAEQARRERTALLRKKKGRWADSSGV